MWCEAAGGERGPSEERLNTPARRPAGGFICGCHFCGRVERQSYPQIAQMTQI
jgi:hypothetical protein